jgi:hypothetical protein
MVVMVVVMMRHNSRSLFGRGSNRGTALKVLERGNSNSRRGSSFGDMMVVVVVAVEWLVSSITSIGKEQ